MRLAPHELARLNRQLAPQGRRLCSWCGCNHPIDEDHWYFLANGKPTQPCRSCTKVLQAERDRQAYADPVKRVAKCQQTYAYQQTPQGREAVQRARDKRREKKNANAKRRRLQKASQQAREVDNDAGKAIE